jgi:glutamate carboxypeptidase
VTTTGDVQSADAREAAAGGAILSYLQCRREEIATLVERLVRIESPSDDRMAFGPLLDTLAAELTASGMSIRRVGGRLSGGMLLARRRHRARQQPVQLLVGHCDTVWPVGTLQSMPVVADDEVIRGPGVFDMKAGLVQMVFALRALESLSLAPAAEPVVVINTDEEIGSPDSFRLIRRLARISARAFVLEPAYGSTGKLKTSRKASGAFTITVRGRAAHAGVNPEDGASAILEMSHQVQQLFALNDPRRGVTVNVGTIDGGLRSNVVAPVVRAEVDVRVRTPVDALEIEGAIRALTPLTPNTTIEVRGGILQAPMEPNARNQSLWRQAQSLGRALGLTLEQAAVGGSSDGNTTSQFTATLDGLGAVGDGAHADHEHVRLAPMIERAALLALLLRAPLDAFASGAEGATCPGGRS